MYTVTPVKEEKKRRYTFSDILIFHTHLYGKRYQLTPAAHIVLRHFSETTSSKSIQKGPNDFTVICLMTTHNTSKVHNRVFCLSLALKGDPKPDAS